MEAPYGAVYNAACSGRENLSTGEVGPLACPQKGLPMNRLTDSPGRLQRPYSICFFCISHDIMATVSGVIAQLVRALR